MLRRARLGRPRCYTTPSPSPSSIEVASMPYPTSLPDPSVFEQPSEEYADPSSSGTSNFTPRTPSDTLLSLISRNRFVAAESLRKEMVAHDVHVPHHPLYFRAAHHAISARTRDRRIQSADVFAAWLALSPDRSLAESRLYAIRRRLFRAMDFLNLSYIYRFGVAIASKGYGSHDAAVQTLSTLARYAPLSVVQSYLREIEDATRVYHSRHGTAPPSHFLSTAYNIAVRTLALAGKPHAALALLRVAHARDISPPHSTLSVLAKRAPDSVHQIRVLFPRWSTPPAKRHTFRPTPTPPQHTHPIPTLPARLHALRAAFRSPHPPSADALYSFISSYHALGRTRALVLLRTLAFRHPKHASVWGLTEMLHFRAKRQPLHVLFVFQHYFYLVGVPHVVRSLLRPIRDPTFTLPHIPTWSALHHWPWQHARLSPSRHHTALVWEAVIALSPRSAYARLYQSLLDLVRQSREPSDAPSVPPGSGKIRLEIAPDAFDAAHFSPFIAAWARGLPVQAARVMSDMVGLGVQPSLLQWSMVARGYAQHGDPAVALGVLDRFVDAEGGPTSADLDPVLGLHTNVLRGFVLAGDVQHAQEVERRLVDRLGYRAADRPATDANIQLLRALEATSGWYVDFGLARTLLTWDASVLD